MAERVARHGDADPAWEATGEGGRAREGLEGRAAALTTGIREVVAHPPRIEDAELAGERPRLIQAAPVDPGATGGGDAEAGDARTLSHRWTGGAPRARH